METRAHNTQPAEGGQQAGWLVVGWCGALLRADEGDRARARAVWMGGVPNYAGNDVPTYATRRLLQYDNASLHASGGRERAECSSSAPSPRSAEPCGKRHPLFTPFLSPFDVCHSI